MARPERPILTGTADPLPDEILWEVTIPSENPVPFVGGRIDVDKDGRWLRPLGPIGADQDQGKKFRLTIVAVPLNGQSTFQHAFETGDPIVPVPSVVNHPLSEICAIRTD